MSKEKEEKLESGIKRLFNIQNAMPYLIKDKEVKTNAGKKMYNYVDINAILRDLQPLLYKEKLVLMFDDYKKTAGEVTLSTGLSASIYCAVSGERIISSSFEYPESYTKLSMQDRGSMITYARRYITINLFNLATTDDDALSLTIVSGSEIKIVKVDDYKIPLKGFIGKTFKEVDIEALEEKIKVSKDYCKRHNANIPGYMPTLEANLANFKEENI